MTTEYLHLHPSVLPVMARDAEGRLKHLESDRWVGYPRAKVLLDQMAFLAQHERVNRPPNLLIVGSPHGGKSFLVKRFRKRHPAVYDPQLARTVMPVLFLESPPVPDEGKFYNEILETFLAAYRPQDHVDKKKKLAFHHIERTQVQLIIIDEIHNSLAGRTSASRQLMNTIKYLSNKLQIPIVATGTLAALRAMQTDEQIASRFEPQALPVWKNGEAWRMFIKRYEATLPLERASGLAGKETADYLFTLSEGLIGELTTTLKLAARQAILTEQENIDMALLLRLGRVAPSLRRITAEKLLK
jgi:SNF2 family DNA or RNA helicase